jgi:hypothetical protein
VPWLGVTIEEYLIQPERRDIVDDEDEEIIAHRSTGTSHKHICGALPDRDRAQYLKKT